MCASSPDQTVQGYLGVASRDVAMLIADTDAAIVNPDNPVVDVGHTELLARLQRIQDSIVAAAALL